MRHAHHTVLSPFVTALGCMLLVMGMSASALAQDEEEVDDGTEEEEGAAVVSEEETAPPEAQSSATTEPGMGSLRRGNRMEFDARLIRGETAGSGAVFLFQRAPRALPSMVPLRKSYLQQSVDQVLTPSWTPPVKKSTTSATGADILESTIVTQSEAPAVIEPDTTVKTPKKPSKGRKKKRKAGK